MGPTKDTDALNLARAGGGGYFQPDLPISQPVNWFWHKKGKEYFYDEVCLPLNAIQSFEPATEPGAEGRTQLSSEFLFPPSFIKSFYSKLVQLFSVS